MTKRALVLGLLFATAAVSTGCHGIWRGRFLCPFGPGCDPQYCCGPTCGPACGPECGPDCGPVCDGPCGPDCGPPCPPDGCGPCHRYFGPLSWLFAQFRLRECRACSGCGEVYWGGYCSDPPDCCDPCDCYGNWTGGCGPWAGGGGYGSAGYVVEGGSPPVCPHCGQAHSVPAGPARVVSRTDGAAVDSTGTPTLAPRQARRSRGGTTRR